MFKALIHVYVQCSHLSVWHMAIYAISAANSALFISLLKHYHVAWVFTVVQP